MKCLWQWVGVLGMAIASSQGLAGWAQTEPMTLPRPVSEPTVLEPLSTSMPVSAKVVPLPASNPVQMIAQAEAIVIELRYTIDLPLDQVDPVSMPITLYLAYPITNHQGTVIVPEGTPISARLQRVNEGIQLVTDGVLVGTQLIDFHAASAPIPLQRIEPAIARQPSPNMSFGAVGSGVGLLISGEDGVQSGQVVGELAGVLFNLMSDNTTEVIHMPAGVEFILRRQ